MATVLEANDVTLSLWYMVIEALSSVCNAFVQKKPTGSLTRHMMSIKKTLWENLEANRSRRLDTEIFDNE